MPEFIPLPYRAGFSPEEMQSRARKFAQTMKKRRTVRDFSSRPIPGGVIAECIHAAGSGPSGANRQPWHFSVIHDPVLRRKIRAAAEDEERAFYEHRAPESWLRALAPLGTDASKPFLETAPVLIAIFSESWEPGDDSERLPNYYVKESVGIATGILITALHLAGLASLTHTPSPMGFLNEILGRPENEKPFLLLVAGYPAADATVPDIGRKSLEAITSYH